MLAYVFWHQRQSHISSEEYHQKLAAFHHILQQRRAPGFLFSTVLQMPHLPWMIEGKEAYEDWYLVENSAALDPLDEAAVTGICREPHNQVARLAGNGTGGLYRLKSAPGDLSSLAATRFATWFNKPAGMPYSSLYEVLHESHVEPQGILWQRQMTMGPALEFCLHTPQPISLPPEIAAVQAEALPIFTPEH